MVIYKITNLVNGKVYIGQTIHSLEERYKQHLKNASKGLAGKLYPAMRKYGFNNFYAEVIEECNSTEELNTREVYWIAYYDSTNKGYNISLGGDINRMYCPQCAQHHRERLASAETRQNISNGLKLYRKDNPFTDLHRARISEALKGNHNFGSGDTRSISCYCIDEFGDRYDFHSYKDAGLWWFHKYKPFGDKYVQPTLQRKIIQSINTGKIIYNNRGRLIIIDNIKWFRND